MKLIVFILIMLVVDLFAENIKTISNIKSKYNQITYFNVFHDRNDEYHIAIFSYDKESNRTFLEIFDRRNKCVFSKSLGSDAVMRQNFFKSSSKLFFFLNKLYYVNINRFKIDSVVLKAKNYTTIQQSNNILIANSDLSIDLYDMKDFHLIKQIKRDESIPWDLPKLKSNLLFFKKSKNSLAILNLNGDKLIKIFNTGSKEVKMLGIKVGSVEEFITDYKIYNDNLYFVTVGGSIYLYKINKDILSSRKSFRGDENNAGLISNFKFTDANLDGNIDFVGAAVDNNIYCINGKDLSPIWQYDTGNENQHPIFLYDINNDSVPEIFGVTYYDQKLYVINGKTGHLMYDKILNNKDKWYPTSVFVDDLNKNGKINIVCKSGLPGELVILELSR